ncbi:MAG TPA: ATP-dependent DNA helicase RecG [Vicinamibacterales bacterium]|jgi:ATP-dependent DNA helicase RecG|nr:ATP-dependent DNA helicase RecG [Vicinamibacterales bacterium]
MSGKGSDPFLSTPLQFLKGVGPRRAADLERAGLVTIEDLLYRFPLRYEDRSRLQSIATLKPGRPASIAGSIKVCGLRSTRRPGFKIFEAAIEDGTGSLRAVWLNQPFLREILMRGQRIVLYGMVEMRGASSTGTLQLTNPQYEILDDEDGETIHTGRIVPVYEKTGAVTPKMQRRLVYDALQRLPTDLPDQLPEDLRLRLGLPSRYAALLATHFPPDDVSIDALNVFKMPAQRRLIFEEAFLFQMGVIARRRFAASERKPAEIRVDDRIRESARRVLPFRLTNGQRTALKEIVDDLQRPQPMNRLLQGDVGAGKTIVALLAAVVAMENGLQVAFMAPTEILAEQHFLNISRLLQASRFRVALLTGSTTAAARRAQLAEVEAGTIPLVVGTHALVQGDVTFKSLGLVVIDEQHRFGVMQRATLRSKGLHPDVLVMTATPIPRTLALTVYGDLDVSVIHDVPPGRLPITTLAKPESRRDEVHEFVRKQLDAGRQAYVIYPLVEESAKVDLKAATEMADHLAADVFPAYHVGLLHGRMKADGKDRVMKAFASGDLHILVSTTVVEVGVDVPNASVMIVEHAERFGLSQLHQLRGRVGRDRHQSYCFLLYQSPLSDEARERLHAMTETTDGFDIAERDLRLRGPGDFFGTRQAGVPTFRMVDLIRDREILDVAQREASAWFDKTSPAPAAVEKLLQSWESRFKLIEVG